VRRVIAGNWKMNGLAASLGEIDALRSALEAEPARADVVVCPPATLLKEARERLAGAASTGGQDCRAEASGAFTGDLSAAMLRDAGAEYVILGHSERREHHGETDDAVRAKADAAIAAGLVPIVCIGESAVERRAGSAINVLRRQFEGSAPASARFVLAYEPLWAIGTGETPTPDEIAEAHVALRGAMAAKYGGDGAGAPILYGGSVKPENAAEILACPEVGGALVGGASLKTADFLAIIRAVPSPA